MLSFCARFLRHEHLAPALQVDLSDNRLTGKDAERLLSSSSHLPVKALSLAKNPIGDLGGWAVVSFLKDKPGMEALDLSGCGVGSKVAIEILETLSVSSPATLVDLSLRENGFERIVEKREAKREDKTALSILSFLAACKALRRLDLGWNR